MTLTVVTGPPCSGKTTHIANHKRPDDIVIDYDAIAVALGSPDSHDHPDHIKTVTRAARGAAIKAAIALHLQGHHVWIIDSKPHRSRRRWYDRHHATLIDLTAPRTELHARARAAGRPAKWHHYIDQQLEAQGQGRPQVDQGGIRPW